MNYFQKGNELYHTQNYKKAIDMYKKSANEKINEASSLYNVAVCLIKLKNYNKAISFLCCAIEKDAQSKYFFNLAYCHSMLNNKQKALLYFNTAWALNPEDTDCEKAINFILNQYKK
ncbi:tetratricopeptide repeat protein [Haloimpatiens lingqiaonensis]|uniref:tetratricopeptide repeat protein n=1 Tax=Haloimpatiens lingqiaonensis TaxID=1380675 RepID=UPI0010FDA182|nr:tetratricopeptide repeat protein [Haloimpatiens lingqiaonensis]